MTDDAKARLITVAVDVGAGALVAALIVATVLFGGAVTNFVYIDF